jgi:transcriptional regulator with PAS, ATPase and Fis domain
VIEIDEPAEVSIPVGAVPAMGGDEVEEEIPVVVWREGMTMDEVEKATILAVLDRHRNNRRRAAQLLGIGERTLYRKLKQFDIVT